MNPVINRFVRKLAEGYPFSAADVWMLARAIHGEGAHLFGEDRDMVGLWIAATAINRAAKPWWNKGIAAETKTAFHGCVNVVIPAPWAIGLAITALLSPIDWAKGSLFMLSGKDLADQELLHLQGLETRVFRHGLASFYFFTFNPWDPPKSVREALGDTQDN